MKNDKTKTRPDPIPLVHVPPRRTLPVGTHRPSGHSHQLHEILCLEHELWFRLVIYILHCKSHSEGQGWVPTVRREREFSAVNQDRSQPISDSGVHQECLDHKTLDVYCLCHIESHLTSENPLLPIPSTRQLESPRSDLPDAVPRPRY